MEPMSGWKTKASAMLIAASIVLEALGYVEPAEIVRRIGEALGVIGIGHKIDKAAG